MITTHVLDLSTGKPAGGVRVALAQIVDAQRKQVGAGVTDSDGRLRDFGAKDPTVAGIYELTFETGAHFTAAGVKAFHPRVTIVFEIVDAYQHFHVPLLISPFGYTTYRGS